ncbi:uncharacterized protein LOC124266103 [Haliotis rubra]|uniref:uncharacterized protein LOC124266103 n=1 Tax=Haliotis rubra TaxID=36100 RepID=UPI001EE607FF|nr:uncharacterized protein LOC124266103 [Haliotis rubra]
MVAHTASTLATTIVTYTAYTLAISVLAGAIGLMEGVRSVPGLAIVPDHVVSSWTVTARVQCYTLCLYSPYCVSVNWRWKAHPAVCDLNKVTESHFPTAVRSDDDSVYIELSAEDVSGRMCRCQPSETCAPVAHQGYLCLRSGFREDTTTGGGREEDETPATPVPTTAREEGRTAGKMMKNLIKIHKSNQQVLMASSILSTLS